MTFSDESVAAFVNEHFVAAWVNRAPGFHNENYRTEKSIYQSAMDAYPTSNICTFFMTPEGVVFDYVAGSYAPANFLICLESAVDIRSSLKEKGLEGFQEAHRRAAKKPLAECRANKYRGDTHTHTEACDKARAAGERYLRALHTQWSAVESLPKLEDVLHHYDYGNGFTEESRNAKRIEGKCIS